MIICIYGDFPSLSKQQYLDYIIIFLFFCNFINYVNFILLLYFLFHLLNILNLFPNSKWRLYLVKKIIFKNNVNIVYK